MDISNIATTASANASASLQSQASLLVLKKALELEQANVAQLLQALPPPAAPTPGATLGGIIDTFV